MVFEESPVDDRLVRLESRLLAGLAQRPILPSEEAVWLLGDRDETAYREIHDRSRHILRVGALVEHDPELGRPQLVRWLVFGNDRHTFAHITPDRVPPPEERGEPSHERSDRERQGESLRIEVARDGPGR